MIRIPLRLGLLALPVALGGCVVAAPVDDYYGPPGVTYAPPVVGVSPYVERHYVIENDRVIVAQPRYHSGGHRYVREYRGPKRHRRWYDYDHDRDH